MNNTIRVVLIGVILAVIFSLLFLVSLPLPNFYIAYAFALIGIAVLVGVSINVVRKNLRIPQDLVFAPPALIYFILNLVLSVIGLILLFAFPILFLILHIILLALFVAWFIILSGGKEIIDNVGDRAKEKVFSLRMMLADVDAIKAKTSDLPDEGKAKAQKELSAVYDALRYSDPMSHPRLAQYEDAIKNSIIQLDKAVEDGNLEKISSLSVQIQRQIKDRNNRVLLMK
jgi:hypothetical protein